MNSTNETRPGRLNPLLAAVTLLVLFATGCKVGPNYLRPGAPVKDEWLDSNHPRLKGEPSDPGLWWLVFNDPELNRMVVEAYQSNLTVRQAGMRILEARARRGIARGGLFPATQSINGFYQHSQMSTNRANFFGANLVPGFTLYPDDWQLNGQIAWELDFWGRFRRAIASANRNIEASVENYDDVLVILLGDLATSYVDMRTSERRLQLAARNVEILSGTLRLTQLKKEAGTVTVLDVAQAEANVAATEALIPQLEITRRTASHRLSILMGTPSRDLGREIGMTGRIPLPPAEIAVGMPADLLRRRPDIRRAERELAAQSEQIGIAAAEFYPHINVTGLVGWEAKTLGLLFAPGSLYGNITPGFNWNILNYGRIQQNVILQDAIFQRLAYAYQAAVLNADREVEDAIVGYLQGHERVVALRRAVNASQLAVDTATEQYRGGAVDFNRVFLLQGDLVRLQDSLAAAEGDVARALIGIFRGMGGGWEIRFADTNAMVRLPEVAPPAPAQPPAQPQEAVAPGLPQPQE
jgi:NodT family efflux transporter outer membrane factor (OMF) lipoprotein